MRILHTADLHLGRQFNGMSLETDHGAILDQIIDAIAAYRPDVLIIAGDIFDRAAPPASAVRQFNAFLTRVARETTTAVVMIAGNHDSGDRIGSMSIMTDARRALIRGPVSAEEESLVLQDAHGLVAFSALPFAYEYSARECFGGVNIAAPEDVLRVQVAAAKTSVPEGARWVIVAHAFVAGGKASESERPLVRVGDIEAVRPEIFNDAHYVALGHLHRAQSVSMARIRYAGAPLAFGFDEAEDQKSMSLVDLDRDGGVIIQAIPFVPQRRLRVLRGMLADILLTEPSLDFVKAVLTDGAPCIDPMKRLREVFPNACELVYARDDRAQEPNSSLGAQVKIMDPIHVVGSFLEHVRGENLAQPELLLVDSALHDLRKEEISA